MILHDPTLRPTMHYTFFWCDTMHWETMVKCQLMQCELFAYIRDCWHNELWTIGCLSFLNYRSHTNKNAVYCITCTRLCVSLWGHQKFLADSSNIYPYFQECYTVIQVSVRLPGGCEAILTDMGILDRYQTTTIQSKACGVLCMDIRSTENKIRKLLIKNVCQEKPILQNCDIVNYQGPQKLHNNT